jgi:hypothetical protein
MHFKEQKPTGVFPPGRGLVMVTTVEGESFSGYLFQIDPTERDVNKIEKIEQIGGAVLGYYGTATHALLSHELTKNLFDGNEDHPTGLEEVGEAFGRLLIND